MFATLLAVVVALVLGHFARDLTAALRDHGWYHTWLRWLEARFPDDGFWRGRYGIALALVPILLVVALLQILLHYNIMLRLQDVHLVNISEIPVVMLWLYMMTFQSRL